MPDLMPPPQGGAPPAGLGALMAHPGGSTGGATVASPMAGHAAQAMTGVKIAVEALQKSLSGLPMGDPLHTAVLKAITDISKNMDKQGPGDQSSMIQQLAQMARGAQTQPPAAAGALQQMSPGGGSPPAMQ